MNIRNLATMLFIIAVAYVTPVATLAAAPAQVTPAGAAIARAEKHLQNQQAYSIGQSPQAESVRILKAREEFAISSFENTEKNLSWQLIETRVIFFMVIAIVIVGLLLSYLQFYYDVKKKEAAPGAVSDFEVSATGIKISSSVIGLIILAMSLAFFFLYLKFVYPIVPIG
jgi:hypothetical protein